MGKKTPTIISLLRPSEKDSKVGDTNLKNTLITKLTLVTTRMELPVCLLENNPQIAGAYKAPPVTAPILKTTSTIPPANGTIKATPMVPSPNSKVASLATFIRVLWLALG